MSVTLRRDVTVTQTDGGMVLLDQKASRYFQLNDTGAYILRLLLDGLTRQSAAERLATRFHLPPHEADRDVAALFDSLSAARLITGRSR
jgi:Coenzyme PQQ synthesis protein D (PqqD)